MAKNIINQYDPNFLSRSALFSDIALILKQKNWQTWPSIEQFMQLLPVAIKNAAGEEICMHHQYQNLPHPEMGYEERIYQTGIISTREQNWHDFFNVFIWVFFPQTKILLNQLHMLELPKQASKKRTPGRDAITHLDESGVIIASSDAVFFEYLKTHQWHEVFVQQRQAWWQSIGAFVFGHGLYEKALNPFIGFTAKAFCVLVTEDFFELDKIQQYQRLDSVLAEKIRENNSLADSRHLSPLPVLGVPGWHAENQNAEFYQNKDYFRPLNKGAAR